MRSLSCSNATSAKAERNLHTNQALYDKYKSIGNMEMVSSMIFSCFSLRENYHQIAGLLAVSDEWKIPISKKLADILFFALCVNCNENVRVKVKTITQASMLFNETENDYKQVMEYEEDTKMRFESFDASKGFTCLFPGTEIEFKIPVRFFRNRKTGKTQRTLGFQKFFKIVLNDEEIQIPIAYLLPFFSHSLNAKGNIGILVEQEDKIGSKFEFNTNALFELVVYAGYSNNKQVNSEFKLPNAPLMLVDTKLVCIPNERCDDLPEHLWEDVNGRKVFLRHATYILIQNKDQYVVLTK